MSAADVSLALRGLEQAMVPPRPGAPLGNWRWSVRQRLGTVREALSAADLDLDARTRGVLTTRLVKLSSDVLERPDLDAVRLELRRLLAVVDSKVRVG